MSLDFVVMTLQQSNGDVRASNLLCQLDVVNAVFNMERGGLDPTDWYDLYSIGWTSPVPQRGDYFVDQTAGVKYEVIGNPGVYGDHIEARLDRFPGTTP